YIDPLGPYPVISEKLSAGAFTFGELRSKFNAGIAGIKLECWDAERDARLYSGPHPVVAHPPCGPWGKLRHMYGGGEGGPELARTAVAQVRLWGGVLEHPAGSELWGGAACLNRRSALAGAVHDLPYPGDPPDAFGG